MERTITLTDGEHVIKTPTYYGLQLIEENGGSQGSVVGRLPAIIAALLTDAEPLDDKGHPRKVHDPVVVAKSIPVDGTADALWEAVGEILNSAMPDAPTTGASDRPT